MKTTLDKLKEEIQNIRCSFTQDYFRKKVEVFIDNEGDYVPHDELQGILDKVCKQKHSEDCVCEICWESYSKKENKMKMDKQELLDCISKMEGFNNSETFSAPFPRVLNLVAVELFLNKDMNSDLANSVRDHINALNT